MKPQKCEETLRRLPEDIIEEILSRVPVKSLLKFRCVSKSLCHLIDGKRFIKTHIKNSIKNSSFAHHRIILNTTKGLGQCSLPSLLNEPFTDSIYYDEFMNAEVGAIHLVGCCNGLVCILINKKRFILWNPATKKSRNLPDFDCKMEGTRIGKYGFGLDEVKNDYKVFGIPWERYGTNGHAIGKVYSLKSNSWKVVEKKDDSVSPFYSLGMGMSMGTYASGKLHWYILYPNKCEIVSFDLNRHVYGVVEQPTCSMGLYRLQVHKGCLIMLGIHKQQTGYELDVWVMKEYGVKETWYKIMTDPCYFNSNCPFGDTLVAMAPNGEVLLSNCSVLKIYNPKYNSFRYSEITKDAQIFESGIYLESLASVDPDAAS